MKLTKILGSLKITEDNSVGKRIFAGSTMIYGDTGWRDVTSLFSDGLAPTNTGKIAVRRTLNNLEIKLSSVTLLEGSGLLTLGSLPFGWTPTARYGTSSISQLNSAGRFQNMSLDVSGRLWWFSETNSSANTPTQTHTRPSAPIIGVISMPSYSWPSSLIGLPE